MKSHLMARWAYKRNPFAIVSTKGTEDIRTLNWEGKGSIVQLVAEEFLLVQEDEVPLALRRWKVLERVWAARATWMVRDGWFQWPVIALWRCSLAAHYFYMGVYYAIRALRGKIDDTTGN